MEQEKLKKLFSKNIELLINASGKDQREVAIALGFEPTTFNTWCKGKILPRLDKLQAIADYFGVTCEDLLSEDLPHRSGTAVVLSPEELAVIRAYRTKGEETKTNVCAILGVKRETFAGSSQRMA